MKTIYRAIKVILITSLISLSYSCKKSFTEVAPKGKLIAQNVSDYNLLLSNLDFLNIGANGQIPMGDEVAAIEPYFSGSSLRTQRLFRWDDVIYQPDEDAFELNIPIKNIYVYNKIINEVPQSTNGTAQEKLAIQAEARAGRAWTYFLLINYFGKPYNPTTSSSDPGFPIITAADVTATQFTRSTVQEVYDFIVTDLNAAIPNLPKQTTHRLRMSKAAAEGILAKVYVFMRRFTEALPMLNDSFNDIANSATPIRLYDYNVTFAPGGAFTPIGVFGPAYPTVPNIEENLYGKQTGGWSFLSNELVLTTQAASLYAASDLRLNFFSRSAFAGPMYPNGLLRRFAPSTVQLGLLLPDLYLLRAECKARLNDLAGAKADLEALRSKRLPAADFSVPATIAAQQTALIRYVIEERTREFALQGYRWFDIRRLSVDPIFSGGNYTHTLYSSSGSVASTYTLKSERLTMRFPEKVINQNPGFQNNP